MLRLVIALAVAAGVASPVLAADAGGWALQERESPLDGLKTVTALASSDDTLPNPIGLPEHASLVVRCQGRDLALYVMWPDVVGGRTADVAYRTDAGTIERTSWAITGDGVATGFFRADGNQKSLVRSLRFASKFMVRATGSRRAQEAVFSVAAGQGAVEKVLAACG